MTFASTTLGFACFAAVKLVGYCLAGSYLRHQFGTSRPSPVLFGLVRITIGIAVGIGTCLLFLSVMTERSLLFYALLAPVRFLEWYFVLTLFFGRPQASAGINVDSTLRFAVDAVARQEHFVRYSLYGIGCSYLLDLPALLFKLPDGAWIS